MSKSGWADSLDESWLQVRDFEGEGFKPLITFDGWHVAILRYLCDIRPERIATMERHTETDEVFVLTKGRGILLVGGNGSEVEGVFSKSMSIGTIYNVRCSVWHTILLSQDASVLVMENRNTGKQNSESAGLTSRQRAAILDLAKRAALD
jgi:hypothetical protein